jgi:hypothetical protein
MKLTSLHRIAALWHAKFFSPKDFVRRAVLLAFFYLVASLAGLREFTSILTGTTGSVELSWRTSAFLGLLYVFIYLAFVLLAPTLLLAASLLVATRRLFPPTQAPKQESGIPKGQNHLLP